MTLTSCYQSLVALNSPHSALWFLQIIFVVFSYPKYIANYLENDRYLMVSYGMQRYANISNNDEVTK